jgi:hypothetical protein
VTLAWEWLRNPEHCPVLQDMIGCGQQYNAKFLRPLNIVATQLARTTRSSRAFDPELDDQINEIADDIQRDVRLELKAGAKSMPLPLNEDKLAGAICPLSAMPSHDQP